MGKHTSCISLDDQDQALLDAISGYCETTKVEVLRWALRHYALLGDWMDGDRKTRERTIGKLGQLVVGPIRKGVAS